MHFDIRPTKAGDDHYLIDIDLKCFDYSWSPEEWRTVANHCLACVATWYGTPIGMAVFRRNGDGDVEVVKVAVKRPYRNRGLGKRLIWNCILYAREIAAPRLVALVPESALRPGEPDDISQWLLKLGFRAQTPLWKDHFHFYGRSEDGVLFTLPIPLE